MAGLLSAAFLQACSLMITLDEKIERTRRLLRRLEEDEPLLATRVAELGREHQESAKRFAARVLRETRAELERLLDRQSSDYDSFFPSPAD
jgi:rubrerythrin